MSLDIWLEVVKPCEIHSQNITHNLNKMWMKAGCYDALYNSAGKKAKKILPILKKAIDKMKKNPKAYKKLDSPNGWGTFEHALPWLEEFYEACGLNPDAIIGIDK